MLLAVVAGEVNRLPASGAARFFRPGCRASSVVVNQTAGQGMSSDQIAGRAASHQILTDR
jgi:hypothetical protein